MHSSGEPAFAWAVADLASVLVGGALGAGAALAAQFLAQRGRAREAEARRGDELRLRVLEREHDRARELESGLVGLTVAAARVQAEGFDPERFDAVAARRLGVEAGLEHVQRHRGLHEAAQECLRLLDPLLQPDAKGLPAAEVAERVEGARLAIRRYRTDLQRLVETGFDAGASGAPAPVRAEDVERWRQAGGGARRPGPPKR